ncbi:MAG: hypothetical protein JSV52_11430 [Candidatus Zixiibacteriota bacterium]|nr:MAG: hypothetical protein JSV52_11430 [candidate division Zixibacteria bacterium]
MAKKHKFPRTPAKRQAPSFDPESSPFFVPIVFVVIFLALIVLFSDFIFSDQMLYLSDQIQAGVFFRTLLVDYIHEHGAIPQWNPYIFGGMPYVEAFHGDIFYPLSALKLILSHDRWQGWTLFLHIFLAGIFMYLAARQFKLSKTAGLFSAACYMFAPYLVSLVAPGHDGKIYVTTLFPLVMFFLERGLASDGTRKALLNFSLLGLVIGVIILSPHPQMSYFALWVLAFYTAFRLILLFREKREFLRLIRPVMLTAYAVVIGLMISAIQFYPGYVYTSEFSPRSDAKRGWDWATSWSMHEEEVISLAIPEFAGRHSGSDMSTPYWGKNAFKDNSESAGTVVLFAALIGFFFYRRRESYFFGGLALFALIYALGATTPLFKIFFLVIPMVKSLRAPSVIMFVFSFSAALLGGMAVQALLEEKDKIRERLSEKFSYLLWGFPALLFVVAVLFKLNGRGMLDLWVSLFYDNAATNYVQAGVSKLDLAYINLPSIQTGAWVAFVSVALMAVVVWLYRSEKAGPWVLATLIALPVISGVRFNSRFVEAVNYERFQSRANPVVKVMTEQEGKFRVMNFTTRMVGENILPENGVEVVIGYHGNQLRWYDNLLGGVLKSNQTNPRFLNLVGAEYILFPGDQPIPDGYFGSKPVSVIDDFGAVKIWRNENALPRAFLVDSVKVFDKVEDIREQVLRGSDDLRRVVYLEKEPSLQYRHDSASADSVWFIDYQADSVLLGVSAASDKILVLTDNYYDAWRAYVDGTPSEVYRSYSTFRAVEIPAGAGRVLFKFESDRYRLGKSVTGLTFLYLVVIIGVCWYTGRPHSKMERKEQP